MKNNKKRFWYLWIFNFRPIKMLSNILGTWEKERQAQSNMDLIPVFPSGAPPSSPSHLDSGEDAGQPSTTYRPSPSAHLSSSHFNQATPMMQYPSVTSSPRGHSPHSVALNAGLSRGNSPHSGSQNSSMSQISYAANSSGHSPKHISSHSRTQNQLSYPTAAQSAHSPKHLSPRLASMMYPSSPRLSSPKSPRISKASTGETSQFSPGLGSSAPQTPGKVPFLLIKFNLI